MRRILLCAVVTLCSGCFQRPPLEFTVPDAESRSVAGSDFPGQATVYIFRGSPQGAVNVATYVDATKLGYLNPGYYAKLPAPAGKRVISLKMPPIAATAGYVINTTLQPDRTYYFYIEEWLSGSTTASLMLNFSVRQLAREEAPAFFAKYKDQTTAPQ